MSILQNIYHTVLPAELRGRIGLGSAISDVLHHRQAKLIGQLACHSPFSSAAVPQRCKLTLEAAGSCYRTLLGFLDASDPGFASSRGVAISPSGLSAERQLAELLNHHGSGKASSHSYHHLYSRALANPEGIRSLVEISIGTNNPAIVTNMTEAGQPGASLSA